MEMWSGLFYLCRDEVQKKKVTRLEGGQEGTFLPITPRQTIDGIAIVRYCGCFQLRVGAAEDWGLGGEAWQFKR